MKIYETIQSIFNRYRQINNNIAYEETKMILKNDKDAILLDVRSPQEYRENHLSGSINLPLYNIESNCNEMLPNKPELEVTYFIPDSKKDGGRY